MPRWARRFSAGPWIALVFGVAFLLGVYFYSGKLRENLAWSEALGSWPETRLVERTFELVTRPDAALARLVVGAPGELRLEVESCEHRQMGGLTRERRIAFDLLCNSPYGETIRDEAEAWNAAFHLVAIRDNRVRDTICDAPEPGQDAKGLFLARGCKAAKWRAYRRLDARAMSSARVIPGASPPLEEFATMASVGDASAYQSDWAAIDGGADESAEFRFVSDSAFSIGPGQVVTIGLAGRARRIEIDYEALGAKKTLALDIDAGAPESAASADWLSVKSRLFCDDVSAQVEAAIDDASREEADEDDGAPPPPPLPDCSRAARAGPGLPLGYTISLTAIAGAAPKGRKPRATIDAIRIDAGPAVIPKAAERASERAKRSASGHGPEPARFSFGPEFNHISANCPIDASAWPGGCRLSWTTRELARRVRPSREKKEGPRFDIELAGAPGENEVEGDSGRITEAAFRLGLSDMIGLDAGDYGGLSWALAEKGGGKARLTISKPIQRAVEDTLAGPDGACEAKSPAICARMKGFAPPATATIVIMDAETAPGDILAMASWPDRPPHRNVWDLRALEGTHRLHEGLAWRDLIGAQKPGSTFKVVTAIAAIGAATGEGPEVPLSVTGRTDLERLLRGAAPLKDHAGILGLGTASDYKCHATAGDPNVVASPGLRGEGADRRYSWCVHNARGVAYAAESEPPGSGGCPAELGPGAGAQLGLCEAIKRSSNLFFGGLARLVTAAEPKRKSLLLEDIALRLSYDGHPCAGAEGRVAECGFDLAPGFDAVNLRADPIRLDVEDGADAARKPRSVVLAGFGDAQKATTLSIATIYASLASGKLVRPTLVPLDRDEKGCPRAPRQGECAPATPATAGFVNLMERLREGLKAVASSPGGTAHAEFASARGLLDRLFVKTGTATYWDIRHADHNSGWTAGWIEGDGKAGPLGRRLAFACQVTGAPEGVMGASVCAEPMRDLLLRLDKERGP